jgi:hypothetical protein
MRFLVTSIRGATRPAFFVLAVSLCASAYAGGKPEKIQFSDPGSTVVASNLNRWDNKSAFKRVEEDIFKPFNSGNSFDGNMVAPFRPFVPPAPALSKRQLEQLEERKNWAFTASTDLLPQNKMEDILHVKHYDLDGQEKKSLSPIEKYYESLGTKHSSTATELSESLGGGRNRDFAGTNAFSFQNFAASTNGRVAWGSPAVEPAPGVSSALTLAEKNRARQHKLEFSNLLEGRTAPGPSTFSNPNGNQGPAVLQGNLGNPALATPPAFSSSSLNPARVEYHNAANPILGAAIHPNLRLRTIADPTARALGIPQTEVKPPEPPPKKPVNPQFTLPQRKF